MPSLRFPRPATSASAAGAEPSFEGRFREVFAAAGLSAAAPSGCGACGADIIYFYEGEQLTAEQEAALQLAAAQLAPATPVRYETSDVIPSPGLVLDLGTGDQRYGTLYCETVNQLSDARLKENIETLHLGRAFVDLLRPVTFRYRGKKRTHMGFIAQEVRDALGEDAPAYALWCETPVTGPATGLPEGLDTVQSLRPDQLIAVLTRCCQEQDDLICDLQAKLADAEETLERHSNDIAYCYDTIAAIQKAIRERPPPS